MSSQTADVLVLGLGAMGSAAAHRLAESGLRVKGFDQFTPPHSLGSSHGQSRMYRQAYWEDPRYVPLLLRAFDLWHAMGDQAGQPLFHLTGGLSIGLGQGNLIRRTLSSAQQFGLPHALLRGDDLASRYPMLTPLLQREPDTVGLLEEHAGYVLLEATIQFQLASAQEHGAELHLEEAVLSWQAKADSVSVHTTRGTYSAAKLVITAGPWAGEVLRELDLPLEVTRQVLFWMEPSAQAPHFAEGRLPVYLFEAPAGMPMVYGFPETTQGKGVKVALHGSSEVTTAATVRREVTAADEASIRERLNSARPCDRASAPCRDLSLHHDARRALHRGQASVSAECQHRCGLFRPWL